VENAAMEPISIVDKVARQIRQRNSAPLQLKCAGERTIPGAEDCGQCGVWCGMAIVTRGIGSVRCTNTH
jgi:hypothetical protein